MHNLIHVMCQPLTSELNLLIDSRTCMWLVFVRKSTLVVLGKMSILFNSTCNCDFTKPCLTLPNQLSILFPNPDHELTQPGGHLIPAPSPDSCCQIIAFKSYQNLEKYTLGLLNLTCANYCAIILFYLCENEVEKARKPNKWMCW